MNIERNKKVEEILSSLDGTKRANMPDFFYTRLKARMQKGFEPPSRRSWVVRPAYALAALVLVLFINTAVILIANNSSDNSKSVTDSETLQSIAAEYNLNDNNTTLFDINQDK